MSADPLDLELLANGILEPEEALRVARGGDLAQRAALATNQNLARAVIDELVVDPEQAVAEGLLMNYELPREALAALRERFRDDPKLCAIVDGHPNAPAKVKMRESIERLSWLSIDRFLDEAQATESERNQLDRIAMSRPRTTLGEAWVTLRP